jgi:hypothetical protein
LQRESGFTSIAGESVTALKALVGTLFANSLLFEGLVRAGLDALIIKHRPSIFALHTLLQIFRVAYSAGVLSQTFDAFFINRNCRVRARFSSAKEVKLKNSRKLTSCAGVLISAETAEFRAG